MNAFDSPMRERLRLQDREIALASLIASARRMVRLFYDHPDVQELQASMDAYDVATGRTPEDYGGKREQNDSGT